MLAFNTVEHAALESRGSGIITRKQYIEHVHNLGLQIIPTSRSGPNDHSLPFCKTILMICGMLLFSGWFKSYAKIRQSKQTSCLIVLLPNRTHAQNCTQHHQNGIPFVHCCLGVWRMHHH